jgi:hypothetical protein
MIKSNNLFSKTMKSKITTKPSIIKASKIILKTYRNSMKNMS